MAGPFELALRQFAEKAGERADAAVREVVFEISARLIYRSPVKTGRFRGNWFYSLDSADRSTTSELVADAAAIYQGGAAAAFSTTINKLGAMPTAAAGHVHRLQNNLPYAWPLEYGHSKQAPNGMVGLTVAEFAGIVDGAVSKVKT